MANDKKIKICLLGLSLFFAGLLGLFIYNTYVLYNPYIWISRSFNFPKDELSCDGNQLVQFNKRYGMYVGLVLCNTQDEFRVYFSLTSQGTYLPATDTAGHGQDFCELVNQNFELPISDDITSSGCHSCNTSRNLPLEHIDTWSRANIGEPFKLVHSGEWSYQMSRVKCGITFKNCKSFLRGRFNTACDAVMDGTY